RVTRIGGRLVKERRAAWERWYGPVAAARWGSAMWHTLGWAIFGSAYVGAVVFVSSRPGATPGQVLLVLAAGSRLSAYIGATVGGWHRRRKRSRQEDAGEAAVPVVSTGRGPHPGGRRGPGADSSRRMAVADGGGIPGFLPLRVSGAPYRGGGRRAPAGGRTGGR